MEGRLASHKTLGLRDDESYGHLVQASLQFRSGPKRPRSAPRSWVDSRCGEVGTGNELTGRLIKCPCSAWCLRHPGVGIMRMVDSAPYAWFSVQVRLEVIVEVLGFPL
jgi:hypothetical protein